jgi:hypothetical protein
MRCRVASLLLLANCLAWAVIIDRIAIIVNNSIIKDSDIDRDLRVTAFLNGEPLDLSNAAKKKAADRLIDQIFIQREIRIGDYPPATLQQADQQLAGMERQRFKTDAAYQQALRRYGLTELDLRTEMQRKLTLLRFIDVRFKPAVLVTDEEIEKYYRDHAAALRRAYPGQSSLDDLRQHIEDILTGEKVNQELFAWLAEQRKEAKIQYREESLR